jgi:hypothetical protein
MTVHWLDDKQPEAAHAASEYEDEAPRRRWGFSTREQAGETMADLVCIAIVLGCAGWALWVVLK